MRIILNGHKKLNSILNEHSHFPGTAFLQDLSQEILIIVKICNLDCSLIIYFNPL